MIGRCGKTNSWTVIDLTCTITLFFLKHNQAIPTSCYIHIICESNTKSNNKLSSMNNRIQMRSNEHQPPVSIFWFRSLNGSLWISCNSFLYSSSAEWADMVSWTAVAWSLVGKQVEKARKHYTSVVTHSSTSFLSYITYCVLADWQSKYWSIAKSITIS